MINILETQTLEELLGEYPINYLEENKLNISGYEKGTFIEYLEHFTEEVIEEWAIDKEKIKIDLLEYIHQMIEFLGLEKDNTVESLTILAGKDKDGKTEEFGELIINKSEIISIVGPTGSGKSRLLADIEWVANGDTPTKRRILINGEIPDIKWRFSSNNRLVAQLSQNMNFVMDLTVQEFLELHARSRMVENEDSVIQEIIKAANNLAGEKFDLNTAITSLSGGQSRALMIADTAILSSAPIVLMATHDPILALRANKRIVIKNGGISQVIETSEQEKEVLRELENMDKIVQKMRNKLREGLTMEP